MNHHQAKEIIRKTFQNSFDRDRYVGFIRNLLNKIDEEKAFKIPGQYVAEIFRDFVNRYERIGTYTDPDGKKVDLLIVFLQKETTLDRARTAQRNFIARYLKDRGEKDAGLIAFVSPNCDDWRFSFVKMDYKLTETQKGGIIAIEEFTPAKRYSFLVGSHESSHTAQRSLLPILEDDERNPRLEDIEKAFNVEKVTKEFFEKYRELFFELKKTLDDLVNSDLAIAKDFKDKSINTVDFSKKLLGQIVFLYFLQKKGWFGVKKGEEWGEGSKRFLRELFEKKHSQYDNFFNDVLEPLFYEALRIERPGDYYSPFKCRIPFLNGGLFDPLNDYNWQDTDIILPNELFSNQIKTPEGDIGTGIMDVFDRYNFTVNEDEPLDREVAVDPEMLGKVFENLLEIKDRKSKGTYYTPREIVHYMCQESLSNYLTTELEGKVTKEDIDTLIRYGETVVEQESRVEKAGKETATYYKKLPESIRKHAKAIDEKLATIRVCDPAVGSGAFPVGMMNEIVRTRTALNPFFHEVERSVYSFKRDAIQNCLYGVDIDPGAVEIAKLRLWLSLIVDEEDIKKIKPLPNLDYKIVSGNSLLGVEKNLFNSHLFKQLEDLKPLFFNETTAKKKHEYKNQIDNLIGQITNGHKDFDFEVYFSEIFHVESGFDVIIANPPYKILTKNNTQPLEYKHYIDHFKAITGSYSKNLFTLFIERSLKLLKSNGTLSYIVPEGLFKTRSYKGCVDLMDKEGNTRKVVTFTNYVFENAVTGNLIFLFEKGAKGETSHFHFNSNYELGEVEQKDNGIISKIEKDSVQLKEVATLFKGMVVKDRDTVLFEECKTRKDRFLLGKNISKWKIVSCFYANYENLLIIGGTKKLIKHNHVPRILIRRTGDTLCCAYLEKPALTESTLYSCWSNSSKISDKFLIALLNSRTLDYYSKVRFITNQQGFPQILMTDLELLPIKPLPTAHQKPFIGIVDRILAITSSNDYSENATKQKEVQTLERRIDQMVYDLYGLNKDEIKIIEESK